MTAGDEHHPDEGRVEEDRRGESDPNEQGLELPTPDRELTAVVDDLEGPKDLELHCTLRDLSRTYLGPTGGKARRAAVFRTVSPAATFPQPGGPTLLWSPMKEWQ